MTPHRLYVGTIGEGLFRSLDGGLTFRRACDGTFVECDVRALAVHPQRPNVLYMGTELGLFRSADGADRWTQVEGPLAGLQVWSIHIPPRRPESCRGFWCTERERTMASENRRSLAPKLDELQEQLESAREEICDIPHVAELNTGELIRVEETLSIAAESAKEVVTIRRLIRRDGET